VASIPDIPFIEGDLVTFQKSPVFLLELFLPMMFLLVRDVFTDGGHVGFGDSKRSITCLPRKSSELAALRLDPFGRRFFDILDGGTDRDGAGQFKEDVNVVFNRVDEHGRAAKVLKNSRHVGMKRIANPVGNDSLAILGAENEMNVEACEGLGHDLDRPFKAV
jgi:putative transposon-encoded protein